MDKSLAQASGAESLGLGKALCSWHDKVSFTEFVVTQLKCTDYTKVVLLELAFCFLRRSQSAAEARMRFRGPFKGVIKALNLGALKTKRLLAYTKKRWLCAKWIGAMIDERFLSNPEIDPTSGRVEAMHRAIEHGVDS